MLRKFTAASLAALAVAMAGSAAVAQEDFRSLARTDLQTLHDTLRDNHPAAVVPGPQGDTFRAWIDRGYTEAQGQLNRVNSGDSAVYLLRSYASGFRDANINVEPSYEENVPWYAPQWPGFTTGWRNGQYVVTYVKQGVRGAPPVGAVLESCNGTPAEEYARNRLDRWEGNLELEADRVRTAPYLLWNRNNPFAGQIPGTCMFKNRPTDRRAREYTLSPINNDLAGQEAAYRATVFTPTAGRELAVETVGGRPWIHVHTLVENQGWAGFNQQLQEQAAAIRGPSGFVLDLRGADGTGYNSIARGYAVANRIWTPEFTVSRQPEAGQVIHRATPANREYFADALRRMQADPLFAYENHSVVLQTQRIVEAYDAAIAAGQQTFEVQQAASGAVVGEATSAGGANPDQPDPNAGVAAGDVANPVQGSVVVLVDGGCTAGCLDVVDLLIKLPNVRLVGNVTSADTIFIEPTSLRLPSGYADLRYGHKVWASRQRGNNQPHTPTSVYTGLPGDEVAVRAWIAGLFGG